MKWLVYIPSHTVPYAYPSYPKGVIAPVLKWYMYRSHIKQQGNEEFWYSNSRIDPVLGTYGCYLIRLLKTDFTFGWDTENLADYDGIIVEGDINSCVYLRKNKKYSGVVIVEPRIPHGLKYPKDVIENADMILINHEAGIETAENLNKVNNTQKFILFSYPTINVDFLNRNFYQPIEKKELRIITYRLSSGPTREDTKGLAKEMEALKRFRTRLFKKSNRFYSFYKKAMHGFARKVEEKVGSDRLNTINRTAEYLAEFRKICPEVKGFMTKAKGEDVKPFIGIDIPYADDFYDYIGKSYMIILASATYASITFYGACVGTVSVGSKETTMQKILFPELSFDEDDVSSVVSAMVRLCRDKEYYVSQQKQGLENAFKFFSDENLEKRFHEILGRVSR